MGKKLIIQGADFSQNGMTPPHTDIEWIGVSTSPTQYISSGVSLKNTSKLIIDFTTKAASSNFPTSSDRGCFIGAILNNSKSLAFAVNASASGSSVNQALRAVYGRTNSESAYKYVKDILDGQRHTFEISPSGYVIDGVSAAWPDNTWANTGDGSLPIYLDSYSAASTPSQSNLPTYSDLVKVHRVRIYDDATTLVFDARPVMKADGTICYYDGVSGNYFSRNDGSTPANSTQL